MKFSGHRVGTLFASCACSVVLCVATPAVAQIDTGGVTGTVTDSTGAIVAGATVKLTNDATGVSVSGVSTSTGAYSFNGVRPGGYTLLVEAPGFQTTIDKNLQVHIQQIQTIDIHLATGAVTQQVTVTGAAPLLQAENGAVGQTITGHVINSMPLKSRNWASLAQLSAGVVTAPKGQPSGDQALRTAPSSP
jgi:carboxypeptidase family protein